MSDSLRRHELQHTRPPCSSPTPRIHPNSWSLSQWCHPIISSSVFPFSFCFQSFPASVCRLFATGDQSIGASAPASILPVNIQSWFPLGLTGLVSLLSRGLSRGFFSITIQKHQFCGALPSLWSNSHIWTWLLYGLKVCIVKAVVFPVVMYFSELYMC